MSLRGRILLFLTRRWPRVHGVADFNYEADRKTYHWKYFWQRYGQVLRFPCDVEIIGKRVLEIGCGQGAVSYFHHRNFARSVVGIDLNREAMNAGARIALDPDGNGPSFAEADAHHLPFADGSFDLVIADNTFEHFTDPLRVMQEAYRVLAPGGVLHVPSFSSIYAKYGAHMKTFIKVPWCNLLFTQKVVVEVLAKLAEEQPRIALDYPAVKTRPLPVTIRGIRRHNDLNDITYRSFHRMAVSAGFDIEQFGITYTGLIGRVVSRFRLPFLSDVFSYQAHVVLRKIG